MSDFSHINDKNSPEMVDISSKINTPRRAIAKGIVHLGASILSSFTAGEISSPKGPVFQTAIIAGVQAAKKTADLIPFCHTLLIDQVKVNITPINSEEVEIISEVRMNGKTGAEMEALTAVSTAALTLYDMCKSMNKNIRIKEIFLLRKEGGKSGTYVAPDTAQIS